MPRYRFPAKPLNPVASRTAAKQHPADIYPTVLETRFPRIVEAVVAMWGYQELNVYFHSLAVNDRRERQGFPMDAWDEINTLLVLHQTLFPAPHI